MEELRNPKEFKAGRFRWLDRIAYRDLGKLQLNLSNSEREEIANQLAISLQKYENLVLNIKEVRHILYRIYNDMITSKTSTSQLSNQFNMSLKGHNHKLRKQIDENFKLACEYEKIGKQFEASTQLRNANLSYDVLFDPKIINAVQNTSTAASQELIKIQQFREKLFYSIIEMAVGLAKKYSVQLDGNCIEWTDLAQEAILASMKAVEKYHPIDCGNTFTSFVYTWISGTLSKKINEITRTVSVPRSTLDRYVYVQKAIDNLGLILSDLRGGSRQFNILASGKIDYFTLCQIADKATTLKGGDELFTPEEIRRLLLTTQEELSLDIEVESADGTECVTLGETLPDETFSVEEQIDGTLFSSRLMSIISQYTTPEELALIKLRYGTGKFRGCKLVADIYSFATKKPMNKGRVSEIEKQVFERIKSEIENNPDLRRQFEEIDETLPFFQD